MLELDDWASRYFRYRDLVEASDQQAQAGAAQVPVAAETWVWLAALAESVLDPVVDRFGEPTITHGFVGPARLGEDAGSAAPDHTQHAGFEADGGGNPVAARPGQAVDFYVPAWSSLEVAQYLAENVAFDRMAFYGPDRPVHISVGPANEGLISLIFRDARGSDMAPLWMPKRQFLRIK